MSDLKSKRTLATYAIVIWMMINAFFMGFELTVFNDAADPNNSILLVLWVISAASLLFTKKYGAVIATFVVIYAFSFNVFNLIYFGLSIVVLNGTSVIINEVAAIYLLAIMVHK
jgi:hypothetical protein